MAARAKLLGVPHSDILVEDQSTTTAENARFLRPLLTERGVQTIWVVSQPFHLRRGRRLLRQQGFSAHASANNESVQYEHSLLAARWVIREYGAWVLHFLSEHH